MKTIAIYSVLFVIILAGCSSEKPAPSSPSDPAPEPVSASAPKEKPKVTAADLQVPFYPDAKLNNEESMVVKTPNETSILAVFTTSDSPEKIKEFYESKVKGLKMSSFNGKDAETLLGETKAADGGKLAITVIKKKGEDTKISIGYGKY